MEEENHLAQDIGTFRHAGAQGGEVPGQLVKIPSEMEVAPRYNC